MELNHTAVTTPPIPAASLVVLRDGPTGMEVLLLKRHGASGTFGGAHVFPGGKLDKADAQDDAIACLDQTSDALHPRLGEPDLSPTQAGALYVAALREAFEECGLLFAAEASPHRVQRVTERVQQGQTFTEVLQIECMRLQTREVLPWSRWITPRIPSVSSKRFDTRFFVARAPNDQVARPDDHEATEAVWLTPREGLTRYWQGEIDLAPPQIMSLVHLARPLTVQDVLQAASCRTPPVIQPEPFEEQGTRVVCYPGDPQHPVAIRALPGPTRLFFKNRRFEPAGGLQDLLP